MSTTFAATNAFNLAETAAVATINADTWLGSATHVATVHQKIRGGDNPYTLYSYAHELPAIGVLAGGGSADDRETIGQFDEYVRLGFDVWVAHGDFDQADQTCKEIISRLRALMRLQTFSPGVNPGSSQLDGYLVNGDLQNEDYDFEYFPPVDAEDEDGAGSFGDWLAHGVTYSLLTIISEA